MKAYKGFDKDMKCRGFQYEVGRTYEEPKAVLCASGFHAVENPLDALNHYPLLDDNEIMNRFAEVDLDATDEKISGDSKRVGKKISIKAELDLHGLIKAAVSFIFENTNKSRNTEKISDEKDAQLAASGYGSQLAASGDGSQLAASGYGSKLAASGYGSKLAASGDDCVVMVAGQDGIAKAKNGSWITLAEWAQEEGKFIPIHVVTRKVDGKRIKSDTWYRLVDGKFAEV